VGNPQKIRSPLSSWQNWRVILLFLVGLGLICGAGWTFLNKGLYLLPDKMCDGSLKKELVQRVLPRAQSADSDSDTIGTGADLAFSCHVSTSNDSLLS
jgi:hypothetical protein